MSNLQRGFQGGDTSDTSTLFRWLERADALPDIQEIKRKMLALGPVEAGNRVLDVGCGIGLETTRLARRVGRRGRVVGIDASAPMIAEARGRAADADLPIAYAVMDVRQLDFPDAAFDLCRTERVLRYVEEPARAVGEMARVVRPGGRVVAFDFDSDATVVDAPDMRLVRRVREVLDAAIPNCWMGRQLPRLFRAAGLCEIAIVPHVLMFPSLEVYRRLVHGSLDAAVRSGELTAEEVTGWWSDLSRAEDAGGLFVANLGFVVHGRRPSV